MMSKTRKRVPLTAEEQAALDRFLEAMKDVDAVSYSNTQRRLNLSYNEACKILELAEREGIVGESDEKGKRKLLAAQPS